MNKTYYTGQAGARRRVLAMARDAGIEVKAVVFTRPQLLKALGYDPGKKYGTKRDKNAIARCWVQDRVIWFRLPATVNTMSHELAHLVTSKSHYSPEFRQIMTAIRNGLEPKRKPKLYQVTVTKVETYMVEALTPGLAKKVVDLMSPTTTTRTMTAKAVK